MKSFSCPYCKGKGGWREAILDDGSGPYEKCLSCDGSGMVEINSKKYFGTDIQK